METLPNVINEELLLKQVTEMVIDRRLLAGRALPEDLVINFRHPHELKELVDLKLGDRVSGQNQLLELCKQAIDYSVRTNHPMFLNQLYHSVDPVGLAGTWLSEALNTNSACCSRSFAKLHRLEGRRWHFFSRWKPIEHVWDGSR